MTKIKEMRLKAGLSQSQLAKLTEINMRTLQAYEQGGKNFNNARIDTIMKACIVLNCKLEDIIDNQEYIELIKKLPR